MPYGFEVYGETGAKQVDQDSPAYQFTGKGRMTLNRRVYDQVDPSFSPNLRSQLQWSWVNDGSAGQGVHPGSLTSQFVAFRAVVGQIGVGFNPWGGADLIGYSSNINTRPVVDWWTFGTASGVTAGDMGVEVFDANGNRTFSSSRRAMNIAAVKNDVVLVNDSAIQAPTAGDYALLVGTPFPELWQYEYNSTYGQWHYLERGMVWGPQSGNGFAAGSNVSMMGRVAYQTPALGQYGHRATLMLVNVAGL